MSTTFPTTLDQYATVPENQALPAKHRDRHQNIEDAMEAVQAKVGVDNSTDPDSLDFRVSALEGQPTGLGFINVKSRGARGNGVTDDSLAIQSAMDELSSVGGGTLYFPTGRYPALNLVPKTNVRMVGTGRSTSILMVPFGNSLANTILVNLTNPVTEFSIEDMGFEGRWLQFQSELAGNGLVTLKFITNLRIRNCVFRYSRAFSLNINECTRTSVTGCLFEFGARDFAAVWGTPDVHITDNVLRGNDDDAISVNWETAGADPVRSQIVIRGNLCEDTGSIRTQAPKNVIISGNTMRRMKGTGIQLGVNNTSTNDISSGHGIVITDNVITDVIDRQWFVSGDLVGSVNNRIGILIRSIPTRAGALAVAPGEVNPATGTVVAPYDWYYKRGSIAAATGSIRAPDGAIVRGNIVKRTLPAVTNYADWGYGQAYTKNGFVNYQVTDAVLRGIGCRIELPWTNLLVDSNSFELGRYGIEFTLATGVTITNRLAKGIVLRGNKIKDADLFGINWGASGTLSHHDITIEGNDIDCDPYFSNANRGTLGSWLANGTPTALRLPQVGGVNIERNRIRNTCQVIDQTGASAVQYLYANELFGDAAVAGFNTGNKGIGVIPGIAAGEQYWFQYEDSDPTSATYGVSLGSNVRNSAAMPSSGKWFVGMVVGSRSTTVSGAGGSQYIIHAWVRTTTGSAHVLNTDWREMRTLTGT